MGDGAGPGVVEAVTTGAEGNPLFLEERLFSMVDTGMLVGGHGRWHLSEGTTAGVPEVLERMVRSRADQLSAGAHDVVRTASVMGAEPAVALLAVTSDAGDQLAAHLAELAAAGVLVEVANAPEPTYRFRHALIQEAIYRGMLRAERRRLHARVAWALEALAPGRLPEVSSVLARHFAAAGEDELAVRYFEMAGDHALRAFANNEAIALFRSALDIAERESSGTDVIASAALRLRGKLAQVLWRTGKRNECRDLLRDQIDAADPGHAQERVRLALLLGQMEIDEEHYEAAAAASYTAERLLGNRPVDRGKAATDLWLEMMRSAEPSCTSI